MISVRLRKWALLGLCLVGVRVGVAQTASGPGISEKLKEADRHIHAARYDSAGMVLNSILKWADERADAGVKAKANSKLGVLHIYRGDYSSALRCIQSALVHYEQTNDLEGMAECHNSEGSIYFGQRNYEMARVSYAKSVAVRQKGDDTRALAISYNNLGGALSKLGRHDEALALHQKSLAIWEALGSGTGKGITQYLIGGCLMGMGRYEEALEVSTEAYGTMQTASPTSRSRLELGIQIGQVLNHLGRAAEAKRWCADVNKEAHKIGSKQEQQNSCLCLYDVSRALKDPEGALQHYQCYVTMRDSIFGQEKTKELIRLELAMSMRKNTLPIACNMPARPSCKRNG